MLSNISYKISMFVDFKDLKAEPGNVIEFMTEFSDYGMMPAVADGSENGNMQKPKFAFAIEQNMKKITIFEDRVDFLCVSSAKDGFKSEELRKMTQQAADIMSRILQKYQKMAFRLAVFKEYMLFELEREEALQFAKDKFAYIPYYAESDIMECSSRVVTRKKVELMSNEEYCNIITMMNRVNFEAFDGINAVMKDAFKIDFDLNTFQGNLSPRFDGTQIESFCLKMNEESDCLIAQIIGE